MRIQVFQGILKKIQGICFYPLFFFCRIIMTVLLKCTEEKWRKSLYGREYEEYYRRVNRCIPWLPDSGKKVTPVLSMTLMAAFCMVHGTCVCEVD